jgi:hypothetical protein
MSIIVDGATDSLERIEENKLALAGVEFNERGGVQHG